MTACRLRVDLRNTRIFYFLPFILPTSPHNHHPRPSSTLPLLALTCLASKIEHSCSLNCVSPVRLRIGPTKQQPCHVAAPQHPPSNPRVTKLFKLGFSCSFSRSPEYSIYSFTFSELAFPARSSPRALVLCDK